MKILNNLTIKHLKLNRKRTIVTIVGIALSTALMVGIGLLFATLQRTMLEEAKTYNGSWHASYSDLDREVANSISKNVQLDTYYYTNPVGSSWLVEGINDYKPFLRVEEGSKTFLETLHLTEGRLPENKNEIVLPNHLYSNGGVKYELGSEIELDLGFRRVIGDDYISYANEFYDPDYPEELVNVEQHKYTIVGFVARPFYEDYSAGGYTAYTFATEMKEHTTIYLEFKNPKRTFTYMNEIGQEFQIKENGNDNSVLLQYYGASRYSNVNRIYRNTLIIILGILSVGCIIVIYNSFAISTLERKKQFGLLMSIGATKEQVRHTVFFEAFFVGIIGMLLGVMGAFLGIYIVICILNALLSDVLSMHLLFTWEPVLLFIPLLFMAFVILISAYLPAKRASKVSPIVTIRGNDEIKINKGKIKTLGYVRKLFGIEGELALKNMKRNKSKYRITVLSLFISVVMFISFSTYLKVMLGGIDTIDTMDFDVVVADFGESGKENLAEISRLNGIDEVTYVENYSLRFPILDNPLTKEYQSYIGDVDEEYSWYTLGVFALDKESYTKYLKEVHLASDTPYVLINQGEWTDYSNNNRKTTRMEFFEETGSLKICIPNEEEDSKPNCEDTLNSIIYSKETPTGLGASAHSSIPYLITSVENVTQFSKYFKDSSNYQDYALYIQAKEYQSVYDEANKLISSNGYVYSPQIEMKNTKNMVLALKILFYGFISLVTLIGVTSVFNTIHTSLSLRRKEFAMLRSVGLTPKGFNRILFFESFFFGIKSLVYALPVSFGLVLLINRTIQDAIDYGKILIPWGSVMFAILGVFIIVLISMMYASENIKKENILDSLREENI